MARKKVTHKFKTKKRNGKTFMICRNSIEDQSYWGWQILSKHPRCNEWSEVSPNSTAVLCYKCVCKTVGPPEVSSGYVSKGRIRGWQFMKVFVDPQGNVFHKGVEQPDLKGTLEPTKPKPPKKKTKSYMRESFEYIKNQAKWQAAKSYCDDKGMKFKLITEKDLGQY